MRLAWHIIAKDLRQNQWALLVWMLLFPAHIALGHVLLTVDPTDLEGIDQLRIGNILLTGLEFAIGYLLALRWVQADDVSGTRMFWATRPISGGRLYAAKVLGLLLVFGLLPVAVWLPWWITCGQGGRQLGWLAVQTFGWQLALIAPAILVGSLTDDFGRAIMWSLILVVAALVWAFFGQGIPPTALTNWSMARVWFSRLCVASVFLVGGFLGIAAAQYFTRNLWEAMIRLAVLVLLVVLVGRLWVVDFSAHVAGWGHPFASDPIPGVAENITLSPKKARVSHYSYKQRLDGTVQNVRSLIVSIDVNGLPDEMGLEARHSAQALRWNDGREVRVSENTRSAIFRYDRFFRARLSVPAVAPDAETIRWGHARVTKINAERAIRGLPPIDDYWDRLEEEARETRIFLRVPESQLELVKAAPPVYTARIDASLLRPEILQELPLEPRERGSGRMRSLLATGVESRVIKVVDTTPAYLSDGLLFVHNVLRGPRPRFRTNVWTVNRQTGDVASVNRRRMVETAVNVGGLAIVWSDITLAPAKWIRNDQWVIKDPDWQKHTVLVMTTDVVVGAFTRSIRSDQLGVVFPPEATPAGSSPESPAVDTN